MNQSFHETFKSTVLGKIVLYLLFIGGMSFIVIKCIDTLDIPIVQKSYNTNACVKILYKGETYKCIDLKKLNSATNYTVQWVK